MNNTITKLDFIGGKTADARESYAVMRSTPGRCAAGICFLTVSRRPSFYELDQ